MPVRPYKRLVVGRRVQGPIFSSTRLIVPFQHKTKVPDLIEVLHQGPDCREDLIGKVVVLPPFGGTELTLTDEDTGEVESLVVIDETDLLAWVDEELNVAK